MDQIAERICFRDSLRAHVTGLLKDSPLSFGQLLQRSLNCDPSVFYHAIDELVEDRTILAVERSSSIVYRLTKKTEKRPTHQPLEAQEQKKHHAPDSVFQKTSDLALVAKDLLKSLPEASPVYSQWWFSARALPTLLSLTRRLAQRSSPTAFLGCSTLGVLFSHLSQLHTAIIDVDRTLLDRIAWLCPSGADLVRYDAKEEPEGFLRNAFSLVFADPPWSARWIKIFLARSASLVNKGGIVVISFPQTFTRPSIPTEREEALRLGRQVGLDLIRVLPGLTEYSVPEFEHAAYLERNVCLTEPWRQGDLLVFKKTRNGKFPEAILEGSPEETWEEFASGNQRVFLKRDGKQEDGEPQIKPFPELHGFTYASTSSRSEVWDSASLVTTRNSVAQAWGRRAISSLLKKASSDAGLEPATTLTPSETQNCMLESILRRKDMHAWTSQQGE